MPRRRAFLALVLAGSTFLTSFAASCGAAAEDLAQVAQKIAQGVGRSGGEADELAAELRQISRTSAVDELTVAAFADEAYTAARPSTVLLDAEVSAAEAAPSIDSLKIQAFAISVSCDVLDRQLSGEPIDPWEIATQEAAAAAIPPLEGLMLVDTVTKIAANLDAGDVALAQRRVDLLIQCIRAGH
jgi:hypothetical protein